MANKKRPPELSTKNLEKPHAMPPQPDHDDKPHEAAPGPASYEGYIVHAWSFSSQARFAGRLNDGRSFAVIVKGLKPWVFVSLSEAARAVEICGGGAKAFVDQENYESMEGNPLARIRFDMDSRSAVRALEAAGVKLYGQSKWLADDHLSALGVKGPVKISGRAEKGNRVDLVFIDPLLESSENDTPLKWLAVDIETTRANEVVAVSLVQASGSGVLGFFGLSSDTASQPQPGRDAAPPEAQGLSGQTGNPQTPSPVPFWSVSEVLFAGPDPGIPEARAFASERELLAEFAARVRAIDPDVLTGWNVLDFDFKVLAERFSACGLPFDLGRAGDEQARIREQANGKIVLNVPGRQAIDAMWLARSSGSFGWRFDLLSLDAVAESVLGEGKTVTSRGENKMAELEKLRAEDPASFCRYCLRDSQLVIGILEKTGFDKLTVKRAAFTGVGLDLAWTSIPTFERIYGIELSRRKIVEPERDPDRAVSGAPGGMVLEPLPGMFNNVLVLDFKSLYPTLMWTFNIDPLFFTRARQRDPLPDDIVAPNGARFGRGEGILPYLISGYFAEREKAQARGDERAAYVYKILMNSFYGVLGANGCRYAYGELAGAVTSFGHYFLQFARDHFQNLGYRVLYGDTDSVFVRTGLPDSASYADMAALGNDLAKSLNSAITAYVAETFDLEAKMRIRFDKAYRRFMIPKLRLDSGDGKTKGRAKGYAALVLGADGGDRIEVKGMEAARSDYTPLARRFQTELLELIFRGSDPAKVGDYVQSLCLAMRKGQLNEELIYRKVLRRSAAAYDRVEPPQVRAARLLGWTNHRGTIAYMMTVAGPEPLEMLSHSPDFKHYSGHQLKPIWDSIAEAADMAESALVDNDDPMAPGKPLAALWSPGPLMALKPFDEQLELAW